MTQDLLTDRARRAGTDDSRGVRLTLSIGPGWHHPHLIRGMAARGALRRTIQWWPDFRVCDYEPGSVEPAASSTIESYRRVVHATWAAWRRIPWFCHYETPQAWLAALYDYLAARFVGVENIFSGWSQISRRSMRAASKKGARTVLDHAMVHAAARQEIMRREYKRHPRLLGSHCGLFSGAMLRRMEREYHESELIVVPSTYCRNSFLDQGIGAGKIACIPYGIDTEAYAVRPHMRRDGFRVLYAGRLELLKGIEYLLQAWREVRLPNAELCLVGRILPETQHLLEKYADPSVSATGEATRSELISQCHRSDLFVFPSLCDGFGLVILEAMACGLPVIATRNSGGPDAIVDGESGFLIPAADAGALAECIRRVFDHRHSAVEMGQHARERVRRGFTSDIYADRMLATYRNLLRGEGDGS